MSYIDYNSTRELGRKYSNYGCSIENYLANVRQLDFNGCIEEKKKRQRRNLLE